MPRVLALLFVGFLSLFALDVFSEYQGWNTVFALLIHLVPSLVLLTVVVIAWRFELVGAVVFIGAAVFYVWDVGFGRPWSWYAAIVGPALLVGLLYFGSWVMGYLRKKAESSRQVLNRKPPL